jgi:hypothetical protein
MYRNSGRFIDSGNTGTETKIAEEKAPGIKQKAEKAVSEASEIAGNYRRRIFRSKRKYYRTRTY